MTFGRPHKIGAALVVLVLIVWATLHWWPSNPRREAITSPGVIAADRLAQGQQKAAAAAAEQLQLEQKRDLTLGSIRKGSGKGFEYPVKQILMSSPREYGFMGDKTDLKQIRRWAGKEAHLIAIRAGYYDWKTGASVRIRGNVSFVLHRDTGGQLAVSEYVPRGITTANTSAVALNATHSVVPTIQASTFLGVDNGRRLPSYEYLYIGDEG